MAHHRLHASAAAEGIMIEGVHAIIFRRQAEEMRAFLRDVLGLPSADAGGGWLIFALPPSELAVHPSDGEEHDELYLMCRDLDATLAELRGRGVEASEPVEQPWGRLCTLRLPGGGEFPLYQPRHASPLAAFAG
jgi:hypothetical protein